MIAEPAKLELPPFLVERAVAAALEEDLGQAGDITTDPIIPLHATAEAEIVARKEGVIAGLDLAARELPHAGEVRAATPARDQVTAFAVLDQGRDDLDDVRQAGSWRRSASWGRGRSGACAVCTTSRRNP